MSDEVIVLRLFGLKDDHRRDGDADPLAKAVVVEVLRDEKGVRLFEGFLFETEMFEDVSILFENVSFMFENVSFCVRKCFFYVRKCSFLLVASETNT